MEREAASEATQAAQADLNAVREHYEAKKAEAEPHRVHRKSLREAAVQLQVGTGTGLRVTSTAQPGFAATPKGAAAVSRCKPRAKLLQGQNAYCYFPTTTTISFSGGFTVRSGERLSLRADGILVFMYQTSLHGHMNAVSTQVLCNSQ